MEKKNRLKPLLGAIKHGKPSAKREEDLPPLLCIDGALELKRPGVLYKRPVHEPLRKKSICSTRILPDDMLNTIQEEPINISKI